MSVRIEEKFPNAATRTRKIESVSNLLKIKFYRRDFGNRFSVKRFGEIFRIKNYNFCPLEMNTILA